MQYGFSLRDMREQQRQKKAAAQKANLAYANRVAGQESSLETFKALYDPDERLMAGNSVDASGLDPQQFNLETDRAAQALLVSLKNSGHEFTDRGVKKFVDYLQHHYVGNVVLDTRRADVLCAAFNRASQINLFSDGDFVTGVPKSTAPLVGRDREEQERREYLADLRKELGDAEFTRRYGNPNQISLGARRPNVQI